MAEPEEKDTKKDVMEEKDNIIVDIFKKLLGINFLIYGGKKPILK
ncbi:MAG: hypothetical protein ACI8ZB_001316 [Desulforhopalus sp.]|jgi:hypothetical protein